ncbi:MAG TPA: hypothetical protein DEF47_07940 [Herpetosiphon sp.]|uniref:hypothetical protein n=1 Tax=Herpetosiphon sp. TaxID=71864 RepID=UPI00059CA652|nr:hypothetical protein [Herpetosiphon sp.]HBW49822.1 hypothetical protein [Herpetosiphon sp.]
MEQHKNLELLREDQRRIATQIAIRSNVLGECEFCEEIIEGNEDIENAYKLGNFMISKNDPSVSIFEGNRSILTDTIKEVVEEAAYDCGCVDRMMED